MTALTLFSVILLAAAISDILTRRIPNWMTGFLALAFLPAAFLSDLSWLDFGWHVLAGFTALVIGFGLHFCRLMGGGDAKLFAGAALWLGWSHLLMLAAATALAGGALAMIFLIIQWLRGDPRLAILQAWIGSGPLKSGMPYGVAIAFAAIWLAQGNLTLI